MSRPFAAYKMSPEARARSKQNNAEKAQREHHLRLLWIAYFEKHMQIKGHLPRRLGTQPLNFEAFLEFNACEKCGKPRKSNRWRLCWECRGRTTIPYDCNSAAKRRRRKQKKEEIAKRGKKERIEALESLSAGDLRDLFNPLHDINPNWPPLGRVHLKHEYRFDLGNLEYWMDNVLFPNYSDIKMIPPKDFTEGATRKRRS